MKRGSVFRISHIQEVYPMPYSTFCIGHIETWHSRGWELGLVRVPEVDQLPRYNFTIDLGRPIALVQIYYPLPKG